MYIDMRLYLFGKPCKPLDEMFSRVLTSIKIPQEYTLIFTQDYELFNVMNNYEYLIQKFLF